MSLDGLVNKINGFKNNILIAWNSYNDRGLLDKIENNPHKKNTPRALKRYGDDHVDFRIVNYLQRYIGQFETFHKAASKEASDWLLEPEEIDEGVKNPRYDIRYSRSGHYKKQAEKYKQGLDLFKELYEIFKRDGRDAFLDAKSENRKRISYLLQH